MRPSSVLGLYSIVLLAGAALLSAFASYGQHPKAMPASLYSQEDLKYADAMFGRLVSAEVDSLVVSMRMVGSNGMPIFWNDDRVNVAVRGLMSPAEFVKKYPNFFAFVDDPRTMQTVFAQQLNDPKTTDLQKDIIWQIANNGADPAKEAAAYYICHSTIGAGPSTEYDPYLSPAVNPTLLVAATDWAKAAHPTDGSSNLTIIPWAAYHAHLDLEREKSKASSSK